MVKRRPIRSRHVGRHERYYRLHKRDRVAQAEAYDQAHPEQARERKRRWAEKQRRARAELKASLELERMLAT